MKKTIIDTLKAFDYFRLTNSFALYYAFIFFAVPILYRFFAAENISADKYLARAMAFNPVTSLFLFVGIVSFLVAGLGIKLKNSWLYRLKLNHEWRKENVQVLCIVLFVSLMIGKIIQFLNGQYIISSTIFHIQPLFGDINNPGSLAYFIGY